MEDYKKLAIVIPTYNEVENIYNLIDEIGKTLQSQLVSVVVIVVDDNSPDGTADLVTRNTPLIEEKYNFLKVYLIKREGKLGLGTAYIRGFKEALNLGADYIMEMDSDFSHQPKYIPIMLDTIKDNDLVIGSRLVRGGGGEKRGFLRTILTHGAGFYARAVLGMPVKDMSAGFKMYKAEVLKNINLDDVKSSGYSFQVEMKYRTFKKGYKIKEVPIIFPDRQKGQSKISKFSTITKTIIMVWKLKFDKSI